MMKELQEDIKQLRSVLAKDSRKYLEMESTNNRKGRELKHKIEETRKTLDSLNATNEYFDLKQNHEAFYRYIKEQENKHQIGVFHMSSDNIDFDFVEHEWRKWGFSDKYLFGKVVVQLVEFYIKNHKR